jgi:pimeloyl-ACP methyl ester carboxylesterase
MPEPMNFAFLHGGGQGAWIWEETLAALGQQMRGTTFHAKAFDLPGCGTKRRLDTSRLTVRDVATYFVSELAASGLEPCILVGHSNAGTILPIVAELRPDLVRRYVYVSCIAPPPGQTIREVMRPRHPIGDEAETAAQTDLSERLRRMFCNDMGDAQATAFLAKLGHDHWPTLQALSETDWRYEQLRGRPASYVICLQDQALAPEWQEDFASRLQVQRRVYIDAGHQAMNTRPHSLAEILLNEGAAP